MGVFHMYKSKYTRSFKMKLAHLYLNNATASFLSKKYNVPPRQISYWAQIVEVHGSKSFIPYYPSPSESDKLSMLTKMREKEWSLGYTSAFFNLSSPGLLSKWQKDYAQHGIKGLIPRKKGCPMKKKKKKQQQVKSPDDMNIKELKRELQYLRAENAVLKKLEALAKEEEEQETLKILESLLR